MSARELISLGGKLTCLLFGGFLLGICIGGGMLVLMHLDHEPGEGPFRFMMLCGFAGMGYALWKGFEQ
jgi:hypothetical protein